MRVKPTAVADSTGLVVSGFGRSVLVEDAGGARHLCHPRGKKNTALVGDTVQWAMTGDEGVINLVHERRNTLYRQDEVRTKSFAANLDQVIAFLGAEPEFSLEQLSRILIACEAEKIPARIVLNKNDLPIFEAQWQRLAVMRHMGYETIALNTRDADYCRAQLMPHLLNRRSFLVGPSGSGKSSVINALLPDAAVATNTLSLALRSGKHTTTSTHLHWLDDARSSALIDSPGFQEFGLAQIPPQKLAQLMPDIAHAAQAGCKFYNCSHLHEPQCAVQAAVQTAVGSSEAIGIDARRYAIYQRLFAQMQIWQAAY